MNQTFNPLRHVSQQKPVPGIIRELKGEGYEREFKKGDVLVKPGRPVSDVPIILQGAISVYQLDDDYKEMLLYYLETGDMCIMSFMGGLYNESSKIKAVLTIEDELKEKKAYRILEKAEEICLITRSIHSEIIFDPSVYIAEKVG